MVGGLAAAALAAALAGCGGDVSAGSPGTPQPVSTPGPELLAEVSERMREAGSVEYVFSGIGGGRTQAGAGTLRFEGDSYTADVSLSMPQTGRVRAVLGPEESFLALPAAKGLPRSKPWLKVTAGADTPIARQLHPVLEQFRATFDPARNLGLLAAAEDLEEVGPVTVEGVATTHYRADVRLRRAVRAASSDPVREQYQSMLDAGATTLTYDVWVDVTGLPRRYSAELPSASGLYSVTAVYRDWGEGADIERPGAKEVYDAERLTGRIGERSR